MPPVIGAVTVGLIDAFATVGFIGPTAFTLASDIAAMVVTAGVSMIISGITGLITSALNATNQGISVSTRDPNAAWRIVYGFLRLSGVITFLSVTGNNNEYLNIVLTICKGKINSIETMYFDGAAIPLDANGNGLGQWNGYVHTEWDVGDPANASQPFPGLASSDPGHWTSACLQRGHAKAYVQLKWNQNLFVNGVPNITFDVKGREIFDPRTGLTGYSTNPALCIRDFLTDQKIGFMAETSEINDTSVMAAASVCDETVALKGTVSSITVGQNTGDAGTGYVTGDLVTVQGGNGDCAGWVAETTAGGKVQNINVSDPGSGYATANEVATTGGTGHGLVVDITATSGTESQYSCNGVFDATQAPGSVLNSLALAMAGYVTYVQGQFAVFAGAWQTPTTTLGDSDFRAPMAIQTRYSRRDIFNSVHGTYLSEANNWQPSDYPAIIDGTWVNEDGATLWKAIDMPFTTSASMAQRIAKIQLELSRRQITGTLHCKLTAGTIQPADIIQVNHSRFSWTNKTFLVTDVSFVSDKDANSDPALGVDLLVKEIDANVFSWTTGDEIAVVPPALAPMPAPGTVQPPTNVTATSGAPEAAVGADGIITNRILLQWTSPADYFVQNGGYIVIAWRISGTTVWSNPVALSGTATQYFIAPVNGNALYDIAIWSINSKGAASAIVEVLSVNTSALISSFTGEAGTVSTLSNFTQDNLVSGTDYQQTPNYQNNENMIQNPIFLAGVAGWAGGGLVSDVLPNGQTGMALQVTSQNFAGALQSNISTLTPGDTYLFAGWIKTGGAGSWDMYRGNYPDASFYSGGSPTTWTPFSIQYSVPANSSELAGQMLWLNAGATSDWIRVWGCSITKVRSLDSEVYDGSTYARPLKVRIADGKPWVDLSESINQNRTTQYISETVGAYYAGEHGADITANHTANDAANLNGIPAGAISPIHALMPHESGADNTSGHVKVAQQGGPSSNVAVNGNTLTVLTGWSWSVTAASTGDAFSWSGCAQWTGAANSDIQIVMVVDGNTGTLYGGGTAFAQTSYFQTCPFFGALEGLSAGAHTLQLYALSPNGSTVTVGVGGLATLTQISTS